MPPTTTALPRPSPWTHLLSKGLCLGLRVRHAHQVPEADLLHGVTGGAHVLVHLVPSANAGGRAKEGLAPQTSTQP